jgi:hypothetical protein
MQCAAHPTVETELRCGKCEKPICPRCMIQSPVGARCRECANLRRPVQYTLNSGLLIRAAGAALAVAVGVGLLWAYLLPRLITVLGLFCFFAAMGFGWLVAEAMGRAARRRRGTEMRVIAVAACVLVYLIHNLAVPGHVLLPRNDLYGYVFVGIAGLVAAGYLK